MPPQTIGPGDTELPTYVGSLPLDALAQVFCLGAKNLTIAARDTYVPGSLEVRSPATLRKINECQHFLLGVLSRLLVGKGIDRERLIARLLELSEDTDIGASLKWALSSALRGDRFDTDI